MDWPTYLLLIAGEVGQRFGDAEAACFLTDHILALHHQAKLMGAISPADHTAKAQTEDERHAAYIAALEAEAGHWELGPGPDVCDHGGAWGGHPDEACMQGWIAPPDSETYLN